MGNFGGSIGAADGTGISPEKDAAPIPMTIFQCEQMFSELPMKADMRRLRRHVRNVPIADVTKHMRGFTSRVPISASSVVLGMSPTDARSA